MKKRGRILVVDDDYGSLEVIATALHADHDIITATNGHDAITMIKEHVPDLIILDVMLPDVSGFDVCRIIKSYDAYADIPVLFLTGLDTLEGEIRGLELGGIDYLSKPILIPLLKLRVRNHLELKARNAEVIEQKNQLMRQKAELERVEQELREASQFSEQIINSAQEGIIVYDRNLRYRVWNPYMEQLTGLPSEEVVGKSHSELFPFVESTGLAQHLESVLNGELPNTVDFPYTVQQTKKTGWASDLSVPLRDTDGTIIGVIATIRDTTWRKQILDDLHNALEETRSANGSMSRLLRTVAHEFRTPLGLLTVSTGILDRYWDRLTPQKRSEQNEHIRNAAQQLTTMLNSIIVFTQTGGRMPTNPPELIDVDRFSRSIAAEIATFWGSDHQFDVIIDQNCGTVLLDSSLFRRIVENLLTNAFRYTPPGGNVSLHVSREKQQLQVNVTDTGLGIPDDEQQQVFEAFYRSSNVVEQRGLGLGLSIVQESLTQVGGTISMTSRIGTGTTMVASIPVNETDDPERATPCIQ